MLGPTAGGKTRLACQLAYHIGGEIISADSRQVYRWLDIGTGKDLDEYHINGRTIAHHVIDVAHPGEQFYLHQFIAAAQQAFHEIRLRHNVPIICGGTGLYLDALRKDFSLTQVPENEVLRIELAALSKLQLVTRLNTYPVDLTEHVDRNSVKRLIRGIEVAEYRLQHRPEIVKQELPFKPYYIGVDVDIDERKQRISARLKKRLEAGLIEESESLLQRGISSERLEMLGLEYKFAAHYLQNKISKEELFTGLQTAIFQFAKRQMTWFRKMEKEGVHIHWVERDITASALADSLKSYF